MKNLALVVAVALLALAVPASAGETTSGAAPAMTPAQPTEGLLPPVELKFRPLIPFCSDVHFTSCSTNGATRRCTDVCGSQLSCTCEIYYTYPHTPVGTYWNCDQEC